MTRFQKMVAIIACLVCLLATSPVWGQEMHTVNTPFQICSAEDRSSADTLSQKLSTMISGLQTEVRSERQEDATGRNVSYYALYVWHPNLTAEDICQELGEKGCSMCSKEKAICPGATP